MAGIIATLGVAGGRSVVERASTPMRRRRSHRFEVEADAGGEAVVAYVGGRGGVFTDPVTGICCAFHGELVSDDTVLSGTLAAERLVSAWTASVGTFTPPEGCFAACLWDAVRGRLVAISDRAGRIPLYWASLGAGVIVAGELKGLLAAGVPAALDVQAWSELLAYEHLFDPRTPLEGIRRLPGGSTTILGRSGPEHTARYWQYTLDPAPVGDEQKWVADFGSLLESSVARRLTPDAALALSGGLDSRCLVVSAGRVTHSVQAATYGTPTSADVQLAAAVAKEAGISHRVLPLEPGFISRGAAETVWISEGHIRCFHVHQLALRALRPLDDRRAVLMGFGGDYGVRDGYNRRQLEIGADPESLHRSRALCVGDELGQRIFEPRFEGELRDRARSGLAEALGRETGEPGLRVHQMIYNTHSVKLWPGAQLVTDDLSVRDPYDDHALLDMCSRLPERLRRDGRLQRLYLSTAGAIGRLPNAKDRVRRSPTVLFARRRNRGTIGDYGLDLARESRPLLDLLLEDRTLDRGQLRREPVRRLIEQTDMGRGSRTRALGMLLTFEIFQRQFIDGDGFPAAVEHA